MRHWIVASVLALTAPAFADDKAKAPKPATAAPVKEVKQPCKRRVVGKGLERKVVCEFEQEVVVTAGPAKPKVVIAPIDGRRVTGRPKQTDPLQGLGPHTP